MIWNHVSDSGKSNAPLITVYQRYLAVVDLLHLRL